jgi:hypothetical protein
VEGKWERMERTQGRKLGKGECDKEGKDAILIT